MQESSRPAAGWYQRTGHPGFECYWDGAAWTGHVRPEVASPSSTPTADLTPSPGPGSEPVPVAAVAPKAEALPGLRTTLQSAVDEAAVARLRRRGWLWLLAAAIGAAISLASFAEASRGTAGGRYIIAWGAVVFGGINGVRYLTAATRLASSAGAPLTLPTDGPAVTDGSQRPSSLGQPAPGETSVPGRRTSSDGLVIAIVGGVVALTAAVAVAGLVGAKNPSAATAPPSTTPTTAKAAPTVTPTPVVPAPATTVVADGTLDQNVLAKAIKTNLTDSLGTGVALTVTCPPGVAIKKGATSTCRAALDGQQLDFTVTQADNEGNVDFEATAAVLEVAKLQTQTEQQYAAEKGGTWTADCGAAGKSYLVKAVGATFECTFTSSTGDTQPYTVTVKDLDGNISWSEQ